MTDLAPDQRIVALNEGILAEQGIVLPRTARILDFCCGTGRHVYEYLDHGYENAYGYDIGEYAALRDTADSHRFGVDRSGTVSSIPFPDNYFDFVHSTSVFEHVQDQQTAFREIYRVLKPGGWSLHNFPAKWRPIEPHIFIPFGAALRARAWYRLWAYAGIRAAVQRELTVEQVVQANYQYGQTGLKYLSGTEIARMLGSQFDDVRMVERDFIRHSPGRSGRLLPLVEAAPLLLHLFRFAHTRVILLGKAA